MGWMEDYRARTRNAPPASIPDRFAAAHVGGIPNATLAQVVMDYCKGFHAYAADGRAPVFFGRSREYKSYSAAVIVKEVARAGFATLWCPCARDILRLEMDKWSESSRLYVRKLQEVPFLVMDDFWEVGGDGFGRNVLVSVAGARYDAQKPTLWTANLSVESGDEWVGVVQRYGASFARRLRDGGREFTVVIAPQI